VAINVRKISPIDLQPRKAVGFNLPFSSKGVFTVNYQTKDAIKNNLINYLLTGIGERYLNPEFGTDIRNKLFNQSTADTASDLEFSITRGIGIYFPRVDISNLTVTSIPDSYQLQVYFSYRVRETSIEDQLVINI
jgi:phage baseplate assembly protein W